jgi:uncharacterized protein YbbK (DUF523 family)
MSPEQARGEHRRSRKVAFVSHCLLNEHTRYLGRACCVREVADDLLDRDVGIVQMPCPEQRAWGGVLKRRKLRLYGSRAAAWLAGIAAVYSRIVFRRPARNVARQIADYVNAGVEIEGVIGVDGSPSCGVDRTVGLGRALRDMSLVKPSSFSTTDQNALVRRNIEPGRGIFVDELARQFRKLRLDIRFFAHDLIRRCCSEHRLHDGAVHRGARVRKSWRARRDSQARDPLDVGDGGGRVVVAGCRLTTQ